MHINKPSILFGILTIVTILMPRALQAQEHAPALESPLISWTNKYRLQYGRPPVRVNPVLMQVARDHAWDMARQEKMAHSLDGQTVVDRAKRIGYPYQRIGENVAYNMGYKNPAWKVFQDWMYSPSHWENIQEGAYTEIGVGVVRSKSGKYYACQVLGRPMQAPPPPVPPLSPSPSFVGQSPVVSSPSVTYPQSPSGYPQVQVPRMQLPLPRGGRTVEFSPVFEMPEQEFYVHPFDFGFGN